MMKYLQRNVPNAGVLLLASAALLLLMTPSVLAVHADPTNSNPSRAHNVTPPTDATSGHAEFTPGPAPYSVTFTQTGIPIEPYYIWGVTVGSHFYTGSGASITVSGITGNVTYSYSSPAAATLVTYATSNCSGTVSGPTTITCTYKFYMSDSDVPEFGAPAMLVAAIGLVAVALMKKTNLIEA